MEKLKKSLREAIPASFRSLQKLAGDENLAAFALCTDADLGSLYAAAYRPSDAKNFKKPEFSFLPAEWPLEDRSNAMQQASKLLREWVDFNYESEPEGIESWDDHLCPWKSETFRTIVDVLEEFRDAPPLQDLPVWLTAHDMGDEMERWIQEGVERLNSEAIVERWSVAWRFWYR